MTLPNEDDTVLDALSAQARAFPPLPLEEVAVLLNRARSGKEDAASETLIEHHLFLALEAALAGRGHGLDVGDLYQEGTLAVIAAVSEYVSRSGAAAGLRAYVEKVITTHLETAVAAEIAARESETAMVKSAEKLDSAEVRMRRELGREATVPELAVELDWPEFQVALVRGMLAAAREIWDEDISQYLDDETEEPD